MAELQDTNRKPWEIVTELGDSNHPLRNDGQKPKMAEENDWYKLMTLVRSKDECRHIWNGLVRASKASDGTLDQILDFGIDLNILPVLSEKEIQTIKEKLVLIGVSVEPTILMQMSPFNFDFREYYFKNEFCFSDFIFPFGVQFTRCYFEYGLNIENAIFLEDADFSDSRFMQVSVFDGVQNGSPNFRDIYERSNSSLLDWQRGNFFGPRLYFSRSRFSDDASFRNIKSQHHSIFDQCIFEKDVDFEGAHFENLTSFNKVTFGGKSRFNNAIFREYVPNFYLASFHPDLDFSLQKENWPNSTVFAIELDENGAMFDEPVTVESRLKSQKSNYSILRVIMQNLGKVEEEQFFYRREMACQRKLESRGIVKFAYSAFDELSDYGWSISKPLIGLASIWIFGWFMILFFLNLANAQVGTWSKFFFAGILSLASTLPAFGTRRELIAKLTDVPIGDAEQVIPLAQFNAVSFITMLQTGLGIFFLFLLFLAIRNRFRLR